MLVGGLNTLKSTTSVIPDSIDVLTLMTTLGLLTFPWDSIFHKLVPYSTVIYMDKRDNYLLIYAYKYAQLFGYNKILKHLHTVLSDEVIFKKMLSKGWMFSELRCALYYIKSTF